MLKSKRREPSDASRALNLPVLPLYTTPLCTSDRTVYSTVGFEAPLDAPVGSVEGVQVVVM